MERERLSLPMVALRGMAVLPEMVTHFDVSREKSIQAIERAMEGDQLLFLAAQKDVEVEDPGIADVYEMGCVVSIKQMLRLPKKITRVLVSGQLRARIEELEQETPFLYASVEVVPDELDSLEEGDAQETSINREAMLRGLKDLFREYMLKNPKTAKELGAQIDETQDLRKLVDLIGANLPLRCEEQQELLEEPDVRKRFELLSYKVVQEIRVQNIKDELDKIAEKGLNTGNLETAYKLVDMLKDMENVEYWKHKTEYYNAVLEEMEGGYSQTGDYSERRKRDSMGRYSRADGMMPDYDRGSSYARRGEHYVRGHYS